MPEQHRERPEVGDFPFQNAPVLGLRTRSLDLACDCARARFPTAPSEQAAVTIARIRSRRELNRIPYGQDRSSELWLMAREGGLVDLGWWLRPV